nr:unnamed protein product [Callosobruchus chinensis]
MRTQKPTYLAALPLGTVNYALFVMVRVMILY